MADEHAILAPSSAHVWGECAGSVVAQQGLPDCFHPRAQEGTAAHWVVSEVLQGQGTVSDYLDRIAPNGTVITSEMVEGAQVMVDDVLATVDLHKDGQLLVEQRVYMPRIHVENWGTLDCALALQLKNTIYIWDYKHGYRETKAKRNKQLINYLAGLVEKFGINDPETSIVMRIVQPFCYRASGPVDEWVCKLSDLYPEFTTLHMQATEALGPSPRMKAGLHCQDCKARGTCAVARKYVYQLIDAVNLPYEIDAMTTKDMAAEREILKTGISVAQKRLDSIEDQLTHAISQGDSSSGLSLKTVPGRLKWKVPTPQVAAFTRLFGIESTKEEVLTPTQIINKAPKEVRPHLTKALQEITESAAGSLKLTELEDSIVYKAFTNNKLET